MTELPLVIKVLNALYGAFSSTNNFGPTAHLDRLAYETLTSAQKGPKYFRPPEINIRFNFDLKEN